MKKRFFSLLIVLIFMFSIVGCSKKEVEVGRDINIASLKGPTSMGLVDLYNKQDENKTKNNYNYKIVQSPDEIVAGLSKGDFDIAAIPANLAAILYNKSEGKLLEISNINTLGVLYLASNDDSIQSIKDLKGKNLILSGKGATPEFVLNYLLRENGLDPNKDVNISFKSEHTEVVSSIIENKSDVALLPEPFLSVANEKLNLTNIISLNDSWKESTNQNLITGVLVVRKEFLEDENNKLAFNAFLEEYKQSVDFTNNSVDDAAVLIDKYEIVKEDIAKKSIKNCNIVYIDGKEMKEDLKSYYEVLFNEDAKSVGGKMPDDGIYYEK